MGEQKRKSERLGDGPVEDKYRQAINAIAGDLDRMFNGTDLKQDRKTGFVLLVFPFNDADGRCNFISNGADRKDIIAMFKEMIARFEGQPEITGHG